MVSMPVNQNNKLSKPKNLSEKKFNFFYFCKIEKVWPLINICVTLKLKSFPRETNAQSAKKKKNVIIISQKKKNIKAIIALNM